MFMNSSITSYYLPLFGAQTQGIATELGADMRSVFVRPITAAGETVLPTEATVTDISTGKIDYAAFDAWLASYRSYGSAAQAGATSDSGDGATGTASASEAEAEAAGQAPADSAEATYSGDNGAKAATEDAEAGSGTATEGGGSSQGSGSGSGSVLGGLLGPLV